MLEAADTIDVRRQLAQLVRTHLGDLANRGGEVLMTGIDSVRRGPLYVMGLNPGMGSSVSVGDHAERWDLTSFSAYKHQCWDPDCWSKHSFGWQERLVCDHGRGNRRHQRVVRKIVDEVFAGEFPLEGIVATNAIFAASPKAESFHEECGISLDEAWKRCWPVHAFLLSIVRPSVVLCWGFGETRSAFSYLRDTSRTKNVVKRAAFKYFDAELDVGSTSISPRIVGVFHPSYGFRLGNEIDDFRALVRDRIGAQP